MSRLTNTGGAASGGVRGADVEDTERGAGSEGRGVGCIARGVGFIVRGAGAGDVVRTDTGAGDAADGAGEGAGAGDIVRCTGPPNFGMSPPADAGGDGSAPGPRPSFFLHSTMASVLFAWTASAW